MRLCKTAPPSQSLLLGMNRADSDVRLAFAGGTLRTRRDEDCLRCGMRQPTIHLVLEGMPGYNPDLTAAAGAKVRMR